MMRRFYRFQDLPPSGSGSIHRSNRSKRRKAGAAAVTTVSVDFLPGEYQVI